MQAAYLQISDSLANSGFSVKAAGPDEGMRVSHSWGERKKALNP